MDGNNQDNRIAGALTFPSRSNDGIQSVSEQPRQPRNLQGLLRFAMEATKAEDAPGNSELGPMDEERRKFLEQALKSLTVDVVELMQKCVKTLTDSERIRSIQLGDTVPDEVESAFNTLLEFVDDIDAANDFYKLGGFAVFPVCYSCECERVRALASRLLGELCQNNPYCQARALECGLLAVLLSLAENAQGETLSRHVYAISCMIRGYEPAYKVLLSSGGCETLVRALSDPEQAVQVKTAFLVRHLCHDDTEIKERFIQCNLAATLIDLIQKGTKHGHEIDYLLGALLAALEGLDPTAMQQCRDPDLGLKTFLQSHLQHPDLQSDSRAEEKEYCQELMRLLFENWSQTDDEAER